MAHPNQLFALFLITIAPGLSACTLLQRHPSSGYSSMSGYSYEGSQLQKTNQFLRTQALQEIESEKGISLDQDPEVLISNRLLLKKLEARLTTSSEKKQYYDHKHFLQTDESRIQFLRLPSLAAKEHFLNNRGVASLRSAYSQQFAKTIEDKDITLGMNPEAVRESWGDPDLVEVAGNPVYGNERWKYSKYVSGESGYQRQTRYVYFENGIVAGWESQ